MTAFKDGSLSALVSLIAKATALVEAHYRASSKPYVPSLDDTEEHPLDKEIWPSEVRRAVQTIEAACEQLCATVSKPSRTVVNREMEIYSPYCLNAILRLKVADALLNKPRGMHVSELASLVQTDANKLGRLLRLMASRHVFREISTDVWANNRLSVQLLSSSPFWNLGCNILEEGRCTGSLPDVLQDPQWCHSSDPRKTCLNRHTGFEGTFFEYMESGTTSGPEFAEGFAKNMIAWGQATEADSIIHDYPWKALAPGTSLCDVGGGIGTMTVKLAKAHPHLKLKLQDTPERMIQAQEDFWPKECPEAIAENRMEFKAIDFFAETPIPGCDIYYLKNIIHDWGFKECVTILKNVRKAMKRSSKVLIHEYIVQQATRSQSKSPPRNEAPEPLLPNYGAGRLLQYNIDMVVLTLQNATERTLEEFVKLAEAADLRFVKVWDFDEMAAIELAPGPGP